MSKTKKKEPEINLQNFPARENSDIRNIIKSPENYTIVSFDYGQLEARVIAMSSKDKVFCEAIWEGSDTHMKWAKRIASKYPKILTNVTIDELRTDVKTNLVFAGFYGSVKESIMSNYFKNFNVPNHIMLEIYEEFWDTYVGVKRWQQDLVDFYYRHGYIESLTGRRRRSPLNLNKIINFPIQSVSSFDICLKAGDRLSRLAYELNKEQYQYVINIHDDLTFYIPNNSLEEDILFIAKELVRPVYDWIIVPLEVELKTGMNWGSMKKEKKFTTCDFYEDFRRENFII